MMWLWLLMLVSIRATVAALFSVNNFWEVVLMKSAETPSSQQGIAQQSKNCSRSRAPVFSSSAISAISQGFHCDVWPGEYRSSIGSGLMFSKILVAADGSEHSLLASKYAAYLASSLNCKVTLVHVLEPAHVPFTYGGLTEEQRQRIE